MSESCVFSDPVQLPEAVALIHDRLVNTSDVTFDEASGVLTIPFADEAREQGTVVRKMPFQEVVKFPLTRSFLRVHHVERYSLDDRAQIETQELNEIRYEAPARRVTVTADVPVEIRADVVDFEISIETTDEMIGARTVAFWFRGFAESARGVIEPI